jgi:microcystin-dependent protein
MPAADSDFHALWMQNLDYPARLDRVFADNIFTAGVLGSSSFQVTPSAPAALTVDVTAGVAVVAGADQANQGKYLVRKQTPETGLAIGAAPGSGQRNDLIVLEVRDPNASGPSGDDVRILVVAGTPDAVPVDPTPPVTSLVLARVRVPAGTGTITSALIDDLRVSADSQHDVLGVPAGTILDTLRTTAPEGYELMQGQTLTNAQTVFPKLWDALPATFKSGSDIILFDMRGRVTVGAGQGSGLTNRVLGAINGAETHTLTTAQLPSHAHTINHGHTATQASHSHTVNSHSHTINHGHGNNFGIGTTGSAHSHPVRFAANVGSGSNTFGTGLVDPSGLNQTSNTVIPSSGTHTHNITGGVTSHSGSSGNTSPGTNSRTPAVTVANHTGSSANTGSGNAHNIMQPFVVTNKMIRVR